MEPDAIDRAVERIDAAREARELRSRISELPARLRAVTELVIIDDLALNEAAAVLRISPGAARVRLHRAKNQLRRQELPTDAAVPTREACR